MLRIALHEYLSRIEGLLDDNRLPEAAAHCHFVLQQYPSLIDAYRLFGRALLEQQLYDEAIDVFERLLSADPEDLISHAGLALAYGESRDLDRAIWHMERAFEVDPYNRAIQDELRKLYLSRDGDAPPRLSLTRAALARLHLRAALYPQAAAEFSRLVTENPDRVDLQLALADTLFWDSKPAEAADICETVLQKLPYCLKANAIRANALLDDERVHEARDHLRRVQALTMLDRAHLDPDTTLGRALSNARISLPKSVPVEVLEDTLAFAKGFQETGSWPQQAPAVVVDGETTPDWLHEIRRSGPAPAAARPAEADETRESEDLIDWLDEIATADTDSRSWEQEQATIELAEAIEEAGTVAEPDGDVKAAEPMTPTSDPVDALQADLQSSSADELEAVIGELPETRQPAQDDLIRELGEANEASIQEEGKSVGGEQEAEELVWEDEPLLALDELRSYVNQNDEPEVADGSAPDWLDELTERTDVADDLPQWLHEAVGLDATHDGDDDLLGSRQAGEGVSEAADDHDGPAMDDENLSGEDVDDSRTGRQESAELSGARDKVAANSVVHSDVPEWLLAADDVLDELPPELQDSEESTGSARLTDQEDDTMSWLDELSAQLTAEDDLEGASSASPEGADE